MSINERQDSELLRYELESLVYLQAFVLGSTGNTLCR